jgi:alpha-L-rhamnosidase
MDEEFKNIVWNMHTFSGKSIHIPYSGVPLESKQRYFYRVKVWTNSNEESDWSETHFWEMGLLDSLEWTAQWISVKEQKVNDKFNARAPFSCSKTFSITKKVKKAVIYVTSLGLYELKLNGKKVGHDYLTPGWTDYNYHIQYQTYDVSDLMQIDNKLRATIGEGWYSGYLGWTNRKDTYGSRNALILQIHIYYEDGSSEVIGSDESWKEEKCSILMSDIYNGEIYDARENEEANIENNVVTLTYPKTHLVAQENEPIRIQDEIKPLSIFKTPKGETILDMGQNMAGFVRFKVKGKKGQKLKLTHGEVLDNDGNFYRDNIRAAAQEIVYICSGNGQEIYQPHFTFQGFRYVKLEGFQEDIKPSDFTGIVLHSDMQSIGTFETSDKNINQLQHNILWGQKGNFIDVPTDCPQRDERLGWTGDAQIFARTACFNMNTAPFFSKWLKDLSYNQMADGAVPFVVPDILKGTFTDGMGLTTAGWGDAAVVCPWTIYQCYGDEKI